MEREKKIRRILLVTVWSLVIIGMTSLLVAASRKQKDHVCREVVISIKGTGEKVYVEKEDVEQIMDRAANGPVLKRSISAVNLSRLEQMLENNAWIQNAELYFDSQDVLHVLVAEREPIARIFTTDGTSYYMDSSGHRMPLMDKLTARLPVVTGFTSAKKWKAADSVLMDDTRHIAGFIYSHEFWNEQIGQIDITPARKFELIPVIGDHIIRVGNGDKIDEKMGRLYVFYKQVLGRVGFNKYAALDLQFDGQVVAIDKGIVSAVDSIQLKKNIEDLVNKASLKNVEEDMLPEPAPEVTGLNDTTVSKTETLNNSVPVKTDPDPSLQKESGSNPAKTDNHSTPKKTRDFPLKVTSSDPLEKPLSTKTTSPKPKAVMKKRGG